LCTSKYVAIVFMEKGFYTMWPWNMNFDNLFGNFSWFVLNSILYTLLLARHRSVGSIATRYWFVLRNLPSAKVLQIRDQI
jgi:hypothetical protein